MSHPPLRASHCQCSRKIAPRNTTLAHMTGSRTPALLYTMPPILVGTPCRPPQSTPLTFYISSRECGVGSCLMLTYRDLRSSNIIDNRCVAPTQRVLLPLGCVRSESSGSPPSETQLRSEQDACHSHLNKPRAA